MTWGPFDITAKNAIVTGGAMGIGFGIVDRFVEAGANVLLVDLDGDAALTAAGKLAGSPGRIVVNQADVSEDGAGDAIVARCIDAFGRVDILVNNAGIYPRTPMLEMAPEAFDRVWRVNVRGLAALSAASARRMIEQETGGKIINISSVDAFHPSMVGLAAYDTSKGAVTMFTKSLALELALHGITVNALAPGGIETEGTAKPLEGSGMTLAEMDEMKRRFIETKIPMHRMGIPDDIAKVAVFLASPASDYITGTTIIVDGGMLLA